MVAASSDSSDSGVSQANQDVEVEPEEAGAVSMGLKGEPMAGAAAATVEAETDAGVAGMAMEEVVMAAVVVGMAVAVGVAVEEGLAGVVRAREAAETEVVAMVEAAAAEAQVAGLGAGRGRSCIVRADHWRASRTIRSQTSGRRHRSTQASWPSAIW